MYCQELTCANKIPCKEHCNCVCFACLFSHSGNQRNMSGVKNLCINCDIYLCHMLLENKEILHGQQDSYYYGWIRGKLHKIIGQKQQLG